jgi:hypothetical protein
VQNSQQSPKLRFTKLTRDALAAYITAEPRSVTNSASRRLLKQLTITTVAELIHAFARLRTNILTPHTIGIQIAHGTTETRIGHNGGQSNEEADRQAKEGAEGPIPDQLDLSIFRKPPLRRRTTLTNVQLTRDALATYNNTQETNSTT